MLLELRLGFYLSRGRAERAVEALRKAVAIAPERQQAHLRLADGLAIVGRNDAALSHYRTALRLGPRTRDEHERLVGQLCSIYALPAAAAGSDPQLDRLCEAP